MGLNSVEREDDLAIKNIILIIKNLIRVARQKYFLSDIWLKGSSIPRRNLRDNKGITWLIICGLYIYLHLCIICTIVISHVTHVYMNTLCICKIILKCLLNYVALVLFIDSFFNTKVQNTFFTY